jgi:hypothetical protein
MVFAGFPIRAKEKQNIERHSKLQTNEPIKFVRVRYAYCGTFVSHASLTKAFLQPKEEGELQVVWDIRRIGVGRPRIATIYVDAETAQGKKTYLFTLLANTK